MSEDIKLTASGQKIIVSASGPQGPPGSGAGVVSDSTLSGDGSVGDPLMVANPFTAADETKLDGIETGAQVNTIDAGDNVSELVNDAGYITSSSLPADTDDLTEGITNLYYTEARVSANSDVVANTAKNTYPPADASKLAGIEAGAEVNTINAGDNVSLLVNDVPYFDSASTNTILIDSSLSSIATYLSGGVYTLPNDTAFVFVDQTYDFGTDTIDFSHTDGCYFMRSTCIPTITYTGTGAFITNSASGTLLNIERMFINTPNGNAFTLTGNGGSGNSLIIKLVVLLAQENASTITDFAFLTGEFPIVIAAKTGIISTNVDIHNIVNPQLNSGQDVGGTFLRVTGTGSLCKVTSVDSRPTASESFLDIDSGYTGGVSVTGGVHVDVGSFFKAGGKNQATIGVKVSSVANVPDSKKLGSAYSVGNTATTTASSGGADLDFSGGGLVSATGIIERWQVSDSSNGEIEYLGNEDFSGHYDCIIIAEPPGSETYTFEVLKNGSPLPEGLEFSLSTGGSGETSIPIKVPISAVTNDKFKIQVSEPGSKDIDILSIIIEAD